jgi:hypothetical protein
VESNAARRRLVFSSSVFSVFLCDVYGPVGVCSSGGSAVVAEPAGFASLFFGCGPAALWWGYFSL